MNWSIFFKLLLRNTLVATVVAAIGLGTLGYFLAGRVGFENGLTWGVILGITGGVMSTVGMFYPLFWGGYASRYGKAQFHKELEGEQEWPKRKG